MVRFLRPFVLLSALGLVGVASIIPTLGPILERIRSAPGAPDLPEGVLVGVLLVQPVVLLLAGVALGVGLAERAGFTSWLLGRARGAPADLAAGRFPSTLAVAAVAALLVSAADLALRGRFPASYGSLPRLDDVPAGARLAGPLYGGLTEELTMRFGLMSLLLVLGMAGLRGRRPAWLVRTAILVSALVFGLAHLPTVLAAAPPDGVIVARTIGLNTVLGIVYGWLYAVRNLEHAMLAHAATHGVFWLATPLLARIIG